MISSFSNIPDDTQHETQDSSQFNDHVDQPESELLYELELDSFQDQSVVSPSSVPSPGSSVSTSTINLLSPGLPPTNHRDQPTNRSHTKYNGVNN